MYRDRPLRQPIALRSDAQQGFGFFDAAVQLFEQGRHLKWDLRSHRASARYRMAMSSRCPKQDMGFHTLRTSGDRKPSRRYYPLLLDAGYSSDTIGV